MATRMVFNLMHSAAVVCCASLFPCLLTLKLGDLGLHVGRVLGTRPRREEQRAPPATSAV